MLPADRSNPPVAQRSRARQADLALIGITAIWGFTFPIVKDALQDASPLLFNAIRMIVAALLLAVIYRRHLSALSTELWRAGAITGALMAAGYGFQTVGLAHTTASKSAFLTGLSVILVPFLIAVVFRALPGRRIWTGAVIALGGLYLLAFFPPGGGWQNAWQTPSPGDLLTLACAFCFAGHIVALGSFSPRFAFQPLAVLMIGFCALWTMALVPVFSGTHWEPAHFHPNARLWSALAVTAVLATAVAFATQAWAQRFTPASHTAIIFALEPVFGLGAAVVWLHERVTSTQLLGCFLILMAIFLTEAIGAGKTQPLHEGLRKVSG